MTFAARIKNQVFHFVTVFDSPGVREDFSSRVENEAPPSMRYFARWMPPLSVFPCCRSTELRLSVLIRPFRFVDVFVKFPSSHSSSFCKMLDPVFTIVLSESKMAFGFLFDLQNLLTALFGLSFKNGLRGVSSASCGLLSHTEGTWRMRWIMSSFRHRLDFSSLE